MSEDPSLAAEYQETSTAHLSLRYRPDTYASRRIGALAARAEQVARFVDRSLKRLKDPGRRLEPAVLFLEGESAGPSEERRESVLPILQTRSARILVTPESSERELLERVVIFMLGDRFG